MGSSRVVAFPTPQGTSRKGRGIHLNPEELGWLEINFKGKGRIGGRLISLCIAEIQSTPALLRRLPDYLSAGSFIKVW